MLVAIPNKSDKVGFRAMRYISLLPVLQNCYVRALQVAVRRERGDPMRQASCGFELERFTAGVTGTLRQVLSKAAEWGVGANVASADVEGAFDDIGHEDVTQALLQKGVHPGTVCLFLHESCDHQGQNQPTRCPLFLLSLYMLGSLARAVWRSLIYGTRCWTMRFGNLLHVGKLRESAFDLRRITAERRRKDVAHPVVLWITVVGCFIIFAGLTSRTRCQDQCTA